MCESIAISSNLALEQWWTPEPIAGIRDSTELGLANTGQWRRIVDRAQ
jgi:hypothetical protein